MHSTPRDLDTPEAIAELLDAFYRKVLADDRLRTLFVDVADIELETHLPHIRAYCASCCSANATATGATWSPATWRCTRDTLCRLMTSNAG